MRRVQRVEAQLRRELAPQIKEILGEKFGLVTLTHVAVQADLKEAKIYISCLESGSEGKILKVLAKHLPQFQQRLNRRLQMRTVPRISFFLDRSWENLDKVEELLLEIKKSQS